MENKDKNYEKMYGTTDFEKIDFSFFWNSTKIIIGT